MRGLVRLNFLVRRRVFDDLGMEERHFGVPSLVHLAAKVGLGRLIHHLSTQRPLKCLASATFRRHGFHQFSVHGNYFLGN